MNLIKRGVQYMGFSRMLVSGFLLVLLISAFPLGINPGMIYADCLVRIGMNGFLVLAMMASIICGAGLNFGLPLGILCGLLGGSIAVQFNWAGLGGFWGACMVSVPFAVIAGYLYAKLLNNVKGSEMTVGNYMAFSIVSLMSIAWLVLPYSNPKIVWPMTGVGLRTTMTLEENYDKVLDNFLKIDFKEMGILQNSAAWKDLSIPTGLLLTFAVGCLLMWLFMKTKAGVLMRCSGVNPGFSKTLGIDNNRVRTMGIIASTVIAAIGINVYSQSYGFYQFYSAPLMMAFPAMAAILIGGATPKKATVFNVVLGVVLFQGLLTMATPVANALINAGSISEVVRIIVQNGIILYALTKIRSNEGR